MGTNFSEFSKYVNSNLLKTVPAKFEMLRLKIGLEFERNGFVECSVFSEGSFNTEELLLKFQM